ncbi:chromosome segregation protein SMC [Desulfosporosinus burensis]
MVKPENFPVFLKGIHIQGFKSFADRVKLELGQGLSVIVGPNGSGKSNVADAVRWVLGEQSAKSLRGAKMEDVIFSGSTQRRQVGMAEVALIFDNSTGIFPLDFREVTITRRVYRDGESQYLINKALSRLKDIQELFMDTGAGKEGFSIIGQGRVEEILNLKSEERRSLIEEAAGITKFRFRKREALKRLDDTVLNLQRLEDIVQEIEDQLTPLAAQAQVAEQSLALSEEQKRLEILGVVLDITEVKQKLSAGESNSETLQAALMSVQAALALKESLNIEDKVNLKHSDETIQRQQNEVFQAEQALNALKHELNLRVERAGYFADQITRLARERFVDEERLKDVLERIKALEAKQSVLKHTVGKAQQNVMLQEERLSEARRNNGTKEIEQLKTDLFDALSEQSHSSNQLTGTQHTLSSLEQQVRQLEQELLQKEKELGTLQDRHLAQEKEQLEIETALRITDQERLRLVDELEKLKRHGQEKQQHVQRLMNQADQTRARLQALQALEDNLEGYQRGVREVMLAKKKGIPAGEGLCGTVAELINVKEDYELALETALGAGLQNIVAESEQAAKAAIHYLKSRQLGRATFLPLDVIQGSQMSVLPAVQKDPGFVGIALDLISSEEKYRPALASLLGRITVVTDMDAATRVARFSGYKLRIVTLEGDQVHPGGSLSGGSVQRKGGNLLGRSREIESLAETLSRLKNEGRQKEQERAKIEAEQGRIQAVIEQLTQEQREKQEYLVMLRTQLDSASTQIRRFKEDVQIASHRYQGAIEQKAELSLAMEGLKDRFEAAEKKSISLREALHKREREAKTAAESLEVVGEQLTQEKIQLAKWEQELSQCLETLDQERLVFQENEASLKLKIKNLEEVQLANSGVDDEKTALIIQLEEQSQSQAALQFLLMQKRQEREVLATRVLEWEADIQKKREEAHTHEQRLHANELRVARWETEWQTGITRLSEEFSLSWEEAMIYKSVEERTTIGQRIQELKQQIKALGPINQAAIEAYPKMLSRHEFMLNQREDLVEANQTLRQLIAELDKIMMERFAESFNAVNQAFKDVFKELFKGGSAELCLVDPEHLLETGVEIIVQPPGKKQQLLSLLSGGERALTAIALLFALLRVKPSPFCLLDEIEASLDDANVQRFAEYIHRLSHSTQFIVISHRKGTMESADVLYGITMEESGVSKLLSVQLDDRTHRDESA